MAKILLTFSHRRGGRAALWLPALAVVAGFLLLGARTEAGPTGNPKATFIKGEVTIGASEAGPFQKVKRNQELPPASFVKTGEGARAELKYPDGSIVRIGPSSVLKLEGTAFNGKSKEVQAESTLVAGKAWAKVAKLVGGEAKFEVKTNNAVAGVRGTIFRVNVDRDEATVVKVYTGAVAVSNSPFFAEKGKETQPASPIDPNRKEIAAPFQEVSKKEWEQIVGKMMTVRIGKDGAMQKAEAFSPEEEKAGEDAEWVRWNEERDSGKSAEKSDF